MSAWGNAGIPARITGNKTFLGNVTVNGDFTVDGSFNFGDVATDTLTANGKVIIDLTDTEALLIRKNADDGDILTVNTTTPLVTINSGVTVSTGQLILPVGAVGTPSATFAGALNSGLYLGGAGDVRISCAGSLSLQVIATRISPTGTVGKPAMMNEFATITNPGFAFVGDEDSGMGYNGAGNPAIIGNGRTICLFNAVASSANYLQIAPSVSTEVNISSEGQSTDIPIEIEPKGTGAIILNSATVQTLGGSSGGLNVITKEATASITADAAITIAVAVPVGAQLIGAQLRVDTALTVGELWDATWDDGASVQAIATAQAVAKNTKANVFFNTNAASGITDAETNVVITKNGGGSFTEGGAITAIVYYRTFAAMVDA